MAELDAGIQRRKDEAERALALIRARGVNAFFDPWFREWYISAIVIVRQFDALLDERIAERDAQ